VRPDLKRLLRYAIATCYPKIHHRLYDHVSESYIHTLTLVKEFSFDSELKREPHQTEFKNDRTFLEHIFNSNTSAVTIPIPRIADLYKLHQGDANPDFELYTCDTCKEFHSLLVNLLESFRTSIRGLSTAAATKSYEDFKKHLSTAISTGYALLAMAKGRAFQLHLETIEGLLMTFKQSIPVPNVVLNEEEGEEEHSEDLKEELEAIQQRTKEPKPLRKIYRDWLQLMVVHFHAADVLYGYINRDLVNFDTISVKILVPPTINRNLLNLEDILTDKDLFFPKMDMVTPGGPSNENLFKFIQDAEKSFNAAHSLVKVASLIGKDWKCREYASVIRQLRSIFKIADNNNWDSIAEDSKNIEKRVKQAEEATKTSPQVEEVAVDILSEEATKTSPQVEEATVDIMISSLEDKLHTQRDDLRLPFQFAVTKLKGSLHCEACLSSMLSPTTRDLTKGDRIYDEIYRELQVDYPLSDFFLSSDPHFL